MIEVTGLFLYPVKGLRGVAVNSAELTGRGLRYDRNWMIVMPNGRMVTQRQKPQLATLSAELSDGYLRLAAVGQPELKVPLLQDSGTLVDVSVWRDKFSALDTGEEASVWLTRALSSDYPLRLVSIDDRQTRPQSKPDLLGENTHTAFADAAPFLITSDASLKVLNEELALRDIEQVPMNRFRPNIVINGLPAFSEYSDRVLRHADRKYRLALKYPSERCIVITTDQKTGMVDKELGEPLRTLKSMNTAPGYQGAYFGQNSILEEGIGEMIKIGDILN